MRRQAVKSASRILEILELFSDERRPLRLNEIYQALAYPQSSTTNLLKSMVMMGYLNYNRPTRTYLPTNRVSLLGNWLMSFLYGQSGYYEALLDELLAKTDETVVIATQNDLFIQYIAVRTPKHEFKVPPPEGTMRLLTDSSAGFALMSQIKDRTIDKLCRYINYYELSNPRVDIEKVLKKVSVVRQQGFCFLPYRPTSNLSSIAFPLGEHVHGIPLAVGVGGFSDRIQQRKEALVEILRETISDFHHMRDAAPLAEMGGRPAMVDRSLEADDLDSVHAIQT